MTIAMLLYRLVTWPFPKPERKGWLQDFNKSLKEPYGRFERGQLPELDVTPDSPVSFGHEMAWLAVKAGEHSTVVDALPINEVHVANWRTGLEAISRGHTYVTPVLDGWVLVASKNLPRHEESGENPLVLELARRFEEVQFFASHEEHDCLFLWSRFRGGEEERTFIFSIEQAAGVACERGRPSAEEVELGLTSFDYKNRPELSDVQRLASKWSIAPQSLGDLGLPEGVGTVGLIRQSLSTKV
ncbi:MAG: hypothetical protein AAGJ46_09305 [Planctomycetota bacterium]